MDSLTVRAVFGKLPVANLANNIEFMKPDLLLAIILDQNVKDTCLFS